MELWQQYVVDVNLLFFLFADEQLSVMLLYEAKNNQKNEVEDKYLMQGVPY